MRNTLPSTKLSLTTLAALAASIAGAHAAQAQSAVTPSVSEIVGTPSRVATDGGTPAPATAPINQIGPADCEANLDYQFDLDIANPSTSYVLQVWAGSGDCSALANRQSQTTSVCWPVTLPTAATTSSYRVDVRYQDIASGAFTTAHPVTYAPTDASACAFGTDAGASNVSLYMFFTDGSSNLVGSVQSYPVTVTASTSGLGGDTVGSPTSGGGCAISERDPASGAGFLGLGFAVVVVSAVRRRCRGV